MTVTIVVVTAVPAPPERVFDLELDMGVHSASLAGSRETATTSTGLSVLGLGDEVTFAARHLGRTWRMTSRVTAHERPHRFVDEQARGPFRSMRHEHVFEATETGTLMTDRMTISAWGADRLIAPYLRRLLRVRAAHIASIA